MTSFGKFLLTACFISILGLSLGCQAQTKQKPAVTSGSEGIQTGAEQLNLYLPALLGKRVGMIVNHTSVIGKTHLVDTLLAKGVTIKTIFAPEHGFRGQATDGELIANGRDPRSGLPIISLYGANRRPTQAQLDSLDVIVFDIQDVGTRFYTYISTMHYAMEACAEYNKPLLILDRPNPNGRYVDGPVLNPQFKSFVGMHPIPILHGLTVGELARMINGQKWLKPLKGSAELMCPLTVVPVKNYTHQLPYTLPVAPSPNLPNQQAILLYPTLCLFEGTIVSVGRGTDKQFQVIGGPNNPKFGSYQFTPVDKPGAVNPPQEGKLCYGLDLSGIDATKQGLTLKYLIDFYEKAIDKDKFFLATNYIYKLYGNDQLPLQLKAGLTESAIRKTWEPGLEEFKKMRMKYLIYP
ncbi:exo-beta-N-acetylmuramidase NamZ domain-containing protein [Larkinella bovis]|uniref:Exo-beta-N-acetylmuramidase NamZ domain-containing protein n=1 Tax=Larkinella bovis TaxID=683041 RepID=A0ABW0I3W0_9BACT